MAALDFPASPTLNQTYTANGRTWTWDGTSWNSTPISNVIVSVVGTANEIAATTVSGTTTLSLPSALTFTGKTITGGTFNSGAFNGTVGATTPSTVAATTITGTDLTLSGQLFLGSNSNQILNFATNNLQFGAGAVWNGSSWVATATSAENIALGSSGIQFRLNTGLTPTNAFSFTTRGTIDVNGFQGAIGATTPSTVAATTIAASGTILSSGPALVNSTSAGGFGFTGGNTTFYSFGANTSTAGGFTFQTLSSNASVNVTPLTITTTGINSTAIGATTPSTGAFTTLSATRGSAGVVATLLSGNAAQSPYISFGRASEDLRLQIAAATNDLFTGTVAGDFAVNSNASIWFGTAGNPIAKVSSTGLAVTGTLNATGTGVISVTANSTDNTTGSACAFIASGFSQSLGLAAHAPARVITQYGIPVGGYNEIYSFGAANGLMIGNRGINAPIIFGLNNTEVGRFTSTGLAVTGALSSTTGANFATSSGNVGIGTSSPTALLTLVAANDFPFVHWNNASNTNIAFAGWHGGAGGGDDFRIGTAVAKAFTLHTNNTERLRIDSAGNVGIGVTPSAWTVFKVLQIGSGFAGASSGVTNARIFGNTYYDGSYRYMGTGRATQYEQDGYHAWYTSASGTAGNAISFTQAMTLDASGNLGIGTTSPAAKLHISGTSAGIILDRVSTDVDPSGIQGSIYVKENGISNYEAMLFRATGYRWQSDAGTDYMLIDSSGNLRVGVTSAAYNTERLTVFKSGNAESAAFVNEAGANNNTVAVSNRATSGDNKFMVFATESSDTTRGAISYNRGAGLVVYGTTSDYRSKDILGPVVDSGALIDSVPVYMGKMKGATQERPMFIAHETPAYAHTGQKDAVDAEGKPVYQQIDTSALLPVLWAELQSLRQRVAALENS